MSEPENTEDTEATEATEAEAEPSEAELASQESGYFEGDTPPPEAAGATTLGWESTPVVMPEDGPFESAEEEAEGEAAEEEEAAE